MRHRGITYVLVCVSGLGLAGCAASGPTSASSSLLRTTSAATPAVSAVEPTAAAGSAESVVREYVAAVNRHDEAAPTR